MLSPFSLSRYRIGFTSKFELFDNDLGYDVDDDDGNNNSNHLFDIEETTSVENLPQKQQREKNDGPEFDYMSFRNVTMIVDSTAYLKCYVKNIGNRTVSWVRHRGINLLTVGTTSYTSDSRFQSIHDHDSEEWILKVVIHKLISLFSYLFHS